MNILVYNRIKTALQAHSAFSSISHAMLLPIVLLMPLLVDGFTLAQLSLFSCYGLLAVSLALVWGQLGLLCLGQAMFFGLGAYAMAFVSLNKIPLIATVALFQTQWFGLLLAMIIPMILAYAVSVLLFNGRRLDGAYLGLVTLALAVIAERFFDNWRYAGGSNGLTGIKGLQWAGEPLSETVVYYCMLVIVVIILGGLYYFKASSQGLILQAIKENETRTQHLGVNTKHVKIRVFLLSAGIAGLSGGLFATQLFFVSPQLVGFALSTEVLIWTAVGGRFSFTAAFIGAVFVRLLEDKIGGFATYWQLILGCIFIAVVLFFPKGLFGKIFK